MWGRSSNHIDPLGAYANSFDGNRALASAKLTGRWAFGALTFQPSAKLIYFREEQEAYTNAIGFAIDNQSIRLGRLTFGPETGYRLAVGGGSVIEPFAKTDKTTAAGEPVGEPWHGRVERLAPPSGQPPASWCARSAPTTASAIDAPHKLGAVGYCRHKVCKCGMLE